MPICKNPYAVDTQKAAQPQDHSHTSGLMSSSPSRELITQPGMRDASATHPHPDRATGMRSSSFLKNRHLNSRNAWPPAVRKAVAMEKKKRKVPQISVESLPRTVNIFGSPQRANVSLSLARSAALKRDRLWADGGWPLGATFSGRHLRQAVGS